MTEYLTQAAAMAAALEAGDPATAALHAADLDTAVAGFETLRATMAADFTALVPVVARGLAAAPGDMLDQLLHLVVQLEPLNPGALLTEVQPPVPAPPEELQAFRDVLAPIIDFLEDLTGLLDFSALEGGVATVAAEAQAIAGRVRDALNDVVIDVRAAFAQVEAAVAGIGLDALAAEMRAAIAQAGDAIEQRSPTPLRRCVTH